MHVYAISDPHLSFTEDKPMSVFGAVWENHWDEITADWNKRVQEDDVVLIAGDISWAMYLQDAVKDLELIGALPGTKILIRGNHDYWWSGISKVRAVLPDGTHCLQNDAMKIGKYVFAGSRGWSVPETGAAQSAEDAKIFEREIIRMEMSLTAADKLREEGDKLIAMIHYPPFNSRYENSPFTELFRRFGVNKVVYGHLHGVESRTELVRVKHGTEYFLTSCDKLGNVLKLVD